MSVSLSPYAGAGAQFFDNNGNPLAGGLIYTYSAGTTTPIATYTSSSGGTANTNPIVLDSAGRTPEQIWLTEGNSYKFVLQTSLGVTIKTDDNIFASYELAYNITQPVTKGANGLDFNLAVGDDALSAPTLSGQYNVGVGFEALEAVTSGASNTAVGALAAKAITSAQSTTAIGTSALFSATTGRFNTAVGTSALSEVTNGEHNIGIGYRAGVSTIGPGSITSGTANIAVGFEAVGSAGSGDFNIGIGYLAYQQGTGSYNIAIGRNALYNATTGNNNVVIGGATFSLTTITSGSNNIIIGVGADSTTDTVSNEITLGNSSITSMRVPGLTMTVGAKWINNGTQTVAALAAAATAGAGARAVVTDASATTFHSIVAGGGANVVPVFSDGTNWRIG